MQPLFKHHCCCYIVLMIIEKLQELNRWFMSNFSVHMKHVTVYMRLLVQRYHICTAPIYYWPPWWGIKAPSMPSKLTWASVFGQIQAVIHLLWGQVELKAVMLLMGRTRNKELNYSAWLAETKARLHRGNLHSIRWWRPASRSSVMFNICLMQRSS